MNSIVLFKNNLRINDNPALYYAAKHSEKILPIYIYDDKGILIQECQLGQIFSLNSIEKIQFLEFLTSTGLQIKADPGIRTVYLSFFLLILSTYVSFISYSQIWGTETRGNILWVGTSNRAVLFFQTKFRRIFNKVGS